MKMREIYPKEHSVNERERSSRERGSRIASIFATSANGRSKLPIFIAGMMAVISPRLEAQNSDADFCLAREGRIAVVGEAHTALYERKLFVTKDEIARYVFLTTGRNDGDRSAAVYRTPGKAGSLPGDYWVTSTEASTSLLDCIPTSVEKARVDLRSVKVRRADSPIPAATAKAVHSLWVTMLEESRLDEKAVPFSPTGVFGATMPTGVRLRAVTAWQHEHSLCDAFINLGESLIDYAKLPAAKRSQAAAEIERESTRLLRRLAPAK